MCVGVPADTLPLVLGVGSLSGDQIMLTGVPAPVAVAVLASVSVRPSVSEPGDVLIDPFAPVFAAGFVLPHLPQHPDVEEVISAQPSPNRPGDGAASQEWSRREGIDLTQQLTVAPARAESSQSWDERGRPRCRLVAEALSETVCIIAAVHSELPVNIADEAFARSGPELGLSGLVVDLSDVCCHGVVVHEHTVPRGTDTSETQITPIFERSPIHAAETSVHLGEYNGRMTILVIGEALIDIVTLPGTSDRYAPGGAPANVALGLGRLGDDVALLTDVGDDFHGGFLLAHLRASNVTVHATPRGATSTARAVLSADGSAEYDFHLRWAPDPAPVTGEPWEAIHIGSIAAFLQPGAATIDALLDNRHPSTRLVTFDPNIRPTIIGEQTAALARFEDLAARVDVVKLSDVDAEWLYPDLAEEAQVDRLLGLGPDLVAMTRGGEGAVLATASARATVASARVDVVDTIGAGDTFMVSLIHDLHAATSALSDLGTAELTSLGDRASTLAGITVGRTGADIPWAADLTN